MLGDQQLINSFINLDQSFTNFTQLKLKGKKIIEQLSNTFYQRSILTSTSTSTSLQTQTHKIIFSTAITNANDVIGKLIVRFQDDILSKYIANVQIVRKNRQFLNNKRQERSKLLQTNYQMLMLELLQLGLILSSQYEMQLELIQKHWRINHQNIFMKQCDFSELKELMLHISFQTQLDPDYQESWRVKLFALSNQRYNSNKH